MRPLRHNWDVVAIAKLVSNSSVVRCVPAIFTPFTSTSTWVVEDLLVLLELSVHGVPVEVDQVAQLLDR
jgi:hypothetical protein